MVVAPGASAKPLVMGETLESPAGFVFLTRSWLSRESVTNPSAAAFPPFCTPKAKGPFWVFAFCAQSAPSPRLPFRSHGGL